MKAERDDERLKNKKLEAMVQSVEAERDYERQKNTELQAKVVKLKKKLKEVGGFAHLSLILQKSHEPDEGTVVDPIEQEEEN